MKLWIARDKNSYLYLYDERPILNGDHFEASTNGHTAFLFNSPLWNEVTFENSPQEVELKLSKEINYLDLFKRLPHLDSDKKVIKD